ncbi:MAG TPA: hypothetical protein VMS56_15235 [Thermoanaerobaculia bacterium]|nr:hypothetical protein [Thermoanaerobaculia bacterium]
MTDERKGGLAFILSTAVLLIVMAIHPTGYELSGAGERFRTMALVNALAHTLAILALPLSFLGALALTRMLAGPDRFSVAALVLYGFALAAGMCAATASGFVTPEVLRRLARAASPADEAWRALFRFTWTVNQACARILVIGSAGAIILWSAALRGRPALRWYGFLSSAAIIALVASGMLRLDIHGFGAVVLLQAVWFVIVGRMMMTAGRAVA